MRTDADELEAQMFEAVALDPYPVGITVILFAVGVVLLCQAIVRRYISNETLRKAHEVGGYYLTLVGTIYGILLGLVVFDAMSKFQAAERTVNSEAKSLLAIYSLSDQFPGVQEPIKGLVREYVKGVITVEWPLMQRGEISHKSHDVMLSLIRLIRAIEPKTQNQQSIYASLLAETNACWESRLDRNKVSNFGVPTAEWVVLLVGATIVIAFTFFFTIESHGIHLAMRGMVTLLIAMSLYLVLLFGAPFSGDLRVSDKPFRFVEQIVFR
jgi:Na+/H+-dicarboxylate symporter